MRVPASRSATRRAARSARRDEFDYAAIGAVTNLAARLADEAKAGQVLITQRLHAEVEEAVDVEPVGELTLKGFRRPVPAFNVIAVRQPVGNVSALQRS